MKKPVMSGGVPQDTWISVCWIYALRIWFREYRAGTYLVLRKSRNAWFPHFAITRETPNSLESFVPVKPVPRWWPFFVFRGYVRHGESHDE